MESRLRYVKNPGFWQGLIVLKKIRLHFLRLLCTAEFVLIIIGKMEKMCSD